MPWFWQRLSNRDLLILILNKQGDIMATQAEILAKLATQSAQLDATLASLAGIQSDITALKDLIAGGANLDEISAAVDALGIKVDQTAATAQGIDQQTP